MLVTASFSNTAESSHLPIGKDRTRTGNLSFLRTSGKTLCYALCWELLVFLRTIVFIETLTLILPANEIYLWSLFMFIYYTVKGVKTIVEMNCRLWWFTNGLLIFGVKHSYLSDRSTSRLIRNAPMVQWMLLSKMTNYPGLKYADSMLYAD